jgi:hypothetical protein
VNKPRNYQNKANKESARRLSDESGSHGDRRYGAMIFEGSGALPTASENQEVSSNQFFKVDVVGFLNTKKRCD